MLQAQKNLSQSFYALLSLPATAMGFALSVQISALSWILSTKYGLNIEEVGYVWLAGPLAGIFGQVIIGIISDKVWFWNGRRRPFILIGATFASLMLLCLPFLDVIQGWMGIASILPVALFVALMLDLSINISFNPTRSIIADVTPDGDMRTKGYTWMQTISGMFGVIAYLIGAFLGNYTLIYVGVFLVLAFSIIPAFLIQEPAHLDETQESSDEREKAGTSKTIISLLPLFIAHAFTWLGIQTMFVFMFAYIKDLLGGVSNEQLGTTIAIAFAILNTVGFILPATVLEPLAKKLGRIKVHAIAILSMSFGYFLLAYFAKSAIEIYLIMAVVGIGWGAAVSLPFAVLSEKVNKAQMGFYMGIFNLSVVIPQLIVSGFFGKLISEASNKNLTFIICAIALAISGVLWFFVKEDQTTQS